MRRWTPLIFIIHPQSRTDTPPGFWPSLAPIIDIECIRPPSIRRSRTGREWWRRIRRVLIMRDLGHEAVFHILRIAIRTHGSRRWWLDLYSRWRRCRRGLRLFPMRRPACHYPTRLRGLRLPRGSYRLLLLNLNRYSRRRAVISPPIVIFLPFPPLSPSAVAFLPFLICFFSFARM
jgi:hypothetical protein